MEKENINSFLKLERLVFDKIDFKRIGFKNDLPCEYEISTSLASDEDESIYRVTLILCGKKKDEYTFEISLSGFFSVDSSENVEDALKADIIRRNTVAIMMPYMRSEVSLLTAQPEMDCLVLPPFNINKLFD